MVLPISRQDESGFPSFRSYEDAVTFFKEKYGPNFIYEDNDGEWYFFALVFDIEVYRMGKNYLSRGMSLSGNLAMDFLKSYQSIQINKNGNIHVVY